MEIVGRMVTFVVALALAVMLCLAVYTWLADDAARVSPAGIALPTLSGNVTVTGTTLAAAPYGAMGS